MLELWCLVVALAALSSGSSNSSQLAEVTVSSPALRVRGGEPDLQERAEVRPLPRWRWERSLTSDRPKGTVSETEGTAKSHAAAVLPGTAVGSQTAGQDGHEESRAVRDSKAIKIVPKEEGRGHMKKLKKKMKKLAPYLMIPGMMALGYAPFVLASLKMFVMNALTLNMMAFNAAIFLTLRNMVFGPRRGEHIKYYNAGYKKKHHHWDD